MACCFAPAPRCSAMSRSAATPRSAPAASSSPTCRRERRSPACRRASSPGHMVLYRRWRWTRACRITRSERGSGLPMLPDRLETERLILRPIARGDALAIFAGYAQDPEVARYLIWRPHRRLTETEAYIGRCLAAASARSRTYALVGRTEGRLLGAFD